MQNYGPRHSSQSPLEPGQRKTKRRSKTVNCMVEVIKNYIDKDPEPIRKIRPKKQGDINCKED